jgi:hypothetical protein
MAVALSIAAAGWSPAGARVIDLKAYRFDPALGAPALSPDLTATASDYAEYGYYLVQADQPISDEWRAALEARGAVIYGYVHEFAFLAGMEPAVRDQVASLAGTSWIGPYQPAYKISPTIGSQVFVSPERLRDPNLTLMVRVFRNLDPVASQVAGLGCRVLDRTDDGFSRRLVVSAPREALSSLARLRDVWWIEEKPEFRFANNVTRWVVQSNVTGQTPIWDHGIHGEGQIATIMDTGVDYNSCWFRDPSGLPPGPANRKIIDYSLFGAGQPYDGCDVGHGSHVAGTMLGDQSEINPGDLNYNGMAYKAKLTVQDIGSDDWSACNLGIAGVPNSLTAALEASYNLGARVHSDSWGSGNNDYDFYCLDADNELWNHKDFLMCVAAGNIGPDSSTVGSPGTAKNVISVGATGQAPHQEIIADYSSRGPAADGRIKPTLDAPGGQDTTYITSVDNDPGNPPALTCAFTSYGFQGTSMATPAVAGCALDARQYYMNGFYPGGQAGGDPILPSAALIRATLLASTDDIGSPDIPNMNEGWGRVLLDNALYFTGDTRELLMEDNRAGLRTGDVWTKEFSIDSSGEPLVVSLAWTDYPGTTGGGVELVNDLDLLVIAPNGSQYLGNVFRSGWSITGGSADRRNVEEGVRIARPGTGRWRARITAHNVPNGPQPFALVLNGDFGVDPAGIGDSVPPPPAESFVRAFPNPAPGATTLHYTVAAGYTGPVALEILDVQGRVVRNLVRKGQTPGDYHVSWRGEDDLGHPAANGIYFARLSAGPQSAKTKIVLRR